ncbi:GvpL/GvpF family gas vesicle protein [Nocardioides sp.]|uniref:GvpL/GvpF family gas vesicle protein n=1 Tax=Nocardioides sp. TaxID=35761 RepID=UPI002ECFD553
MAEAARYLYAVARGTEPAQLADVSGLRGSSVEVIRYRDLDAVVSDVPLAEFDEDALKENLEQLSWLEEVARGHHEVVHAVSARAPTAPMRLATIFLDDDAVRRRLSELYDALVEVLDRVERRVEWSVKAVAPEPAPTPVTVPEPTSGAEFLRRRRAQADEREERQDTGARAAEAIHHALSEVSVASRILAPQDPQLTGITGTMILNGAYLVAVDAQEAFAARLSEVEETHGDLRIESGGPWPPYSFATLESA